MLTKDLRARIKALKTIIPDDIDTRRDVVVDLRRNDPVIDLSDDKDPSAHVIDDERVVDIAPAVDPIPARGLGAVPIAAAPIFATLERADRELAHLVAAGMSDHEIAEVLDIAPRSAHLAVRSLLSLTGYETRMDLMIGWHRG